MKKGETFKLKGHIYASHHAGNECGGGALHVPLHEVVTKVTPSAIYYHAKYPDGRFGKIYCATISYLYRCLDWAAMNDDPNDSQKDVLAAFDKAIEASKQ